MADTPVPHQRLGLWQSSGVMVGQNVSSQYCMDAASEAEMNAFSSQLRNKSCRSSSVTHNADGSWSSSSTCEYTRGKLRTTHATVTGDFNSKITMVMKYEGSDKPEITMAMTWMGPCEAGMRGGDVIMSNGMKMNVLDGANAGH